MRKPNIVFNLLLFIVFGVGALALSGCSGGFGGKESRDTVFEAAPQTQADQNILSAPPSGQTVKVALLVPLSGRNAALGQGLLNAAQMALFDIGFENFELLPHDTGGSAQGAAAAAQDVIAQGAQLILGPVFAEEVRAVKPAARTAGINVIAFSTDHGLADNNTFIMGFLPFDQVERIVNYAAAHNLKRIALITPASDYGRTVASAYQTAASRAGIVTSQAISVQPENPDVEMLRRFAASGAGFDAVFMPFGGKSAVGVGSALIEGGLPPSVFRLGTGLMDDPVLAGRGELSGALFAAPAPAARAPFEQRYSQTYGAGPPRLSTLAYDATALAIVLSQKGRRESGALFDRAAIMNPNGFAGLDGIFRFRQNGMAERGLAMLGFKNGRIEVVDPAPSTFQASGY